MIHESDGAHGREPPPTHDALTGGCAAIGAAGAALAVLSVPLWGSVAVAAAMVLAYTLASTWHARCASRGTAAMLGMGLGLAAGANAAVLAWLVGPVGLAVAAVALPSSISRARRSPAYRAALGWLSWLMPLSWPSTALGVCVLAANLVASLAARNRGACRIRSVGLDSATGTLLLHGGLANLPRTGWNCANIAFCHHGLEPWEADDLFRHETGHTLNVAAFGSVFHLLGWVDEVVLRRGERAFAEVLAESHRSPAGAAPSRR